MPTIWTQISGNPTTFFPINPTTNWNIIFPKTTIFTKISPKTTNFLQILPQNTVFLLKNPGNTLFFQINPAKFPLIAGQHLLSYANWNYILSDNQNYFEEVMRLKIMTPFGANKIWAMGNLTTCDVQLFATNPSGKNYYSQFSNYGTNVVKFDLPIPDTTQDDIWTFSLAVRGKKVKIHGLHIVLTADGIGGWISIDPQNTTYTKISPTTTKWIVQNSITTAWFPILPTPTLWGVA